MDALLRMDPATVDHLARHGALPPEAPSTTEPASDPDELDQLDQLDQEELEPFGNPDLDDPRFVALEALAHDHRIAAPEVIEQLVAYGPERLRILDDRLRDAVSAYRFVPDLQREKLEVIADVRRRIDAKKNALSDDARARLDRFYPYLEVDTPFDVDDLPAWLRQQLADTSGHPARAVVLATGGSKADIHNARAIHDAFGALDTSTGAVPVAADFFVIPEIVDAIAHDGPIVMGLAVLVLLLTAAASFRGLAGPIAVALTVGVALAWLAGTASVLGWKANLFNVIALPLLVGMGQDDAIHLLARWREQGGRDVGRALRETGAAIVLTTATTCCGFGGILFADHRGLQSLAWVAVVGMLACLLASAVLLPAALAIGRWLAGGSRR